MHQSTPHLTFHLTTLHDKSIMSQLVNQKFYHTNLPELPKDFTIMSLWVLVILATTNYYYEWAVVMIDY